MRRLNLMQTMRFYLVVQNQLIFRGQKIEDFSVNLESDSEYIDKGNVIHY